MLVEEERDHVEVKASHIMKMVPADSLDAIKKAQIDSIAKIVTRENFAEVASVSPKTAAAVLAAVTSVGSAKA